jgi:hypothetical protein
VSAGRQRATSVLSAAPPQRTTGKTGEHHCRDKDPAQVAALAQTWMMTVLSCCWPRPNRGGDTLAVGKATRRALGVLTVAALVLLAPAVAEAHPPGPLSVDVAYYRTEITGITPPASGLTATVDPAGEWIELSTTGPGTVIVLGYTGEPYLRLTANSAEENQLSATTYLNRSMFADSVPTGQSPANVAPAWKQIGSTGRVRWHDHRIHWMGSARPPTVAADPTHPHLVGTWTVHVTVESASVDIRGTLRWLGKPANAGWLSGLTAWLAAILAGLSVCIGVLTVALLRTHRRSSVSPISLPK